MKKVLSMILALTLIISLCAISASAIDEKPYKVYTALGDSIPAGYGPYNYAIKGYARVDAAYTAIVADHAAEKFIPLGRTGFRTEELRYMLDPTYEGDDALFSLSKFTEDKEYYRNYYPKAVSESDLISIQIGSNDVLNYAFQYCKSVITDESLIRQFENEVNQYLENTGDTGGAVLKMVQLAEQAGETGIMVGAFIEGLTKGLTGFMRNWEAIMKQITSLAPNAKIVAVGMYNPLKTTKLMDSSLIQIGKAFAVITEQMNFFMKYQSAYRNSYTFVDVRDIEIYTVPAFTSSAFSNQMVGFVHPTEAGHREIANRILNTLGIDAAIEAKEKHPDPKYLDTVNHKAYVSGYGDGTFRPDQSATRAEVASMLYSLLKDEYKRDIAEDQFNDIKGHWSNKQINTVASLGLVSGYKDGTFQPDRAVTRGEMAAILSNLFDDVDTNNAKNFTDISGHWSASYVKKASTLGIVSGYADGTFKPDAKITRAQLVTMIHATLGRDVDLAGFYTFPERIQFSDVTNSKVYYFTPVTEASNSHEYEFNADKEVWTSLTN